jgi:hypothetical protein
MAVPGSGAGSDGAELWLWDDVQAMSSGYGMMCRLWALVMGWWTGYELRLWDDVYATYVMMCMLRMRWCACYVRVCDDVQATSKTINQSEQNLTFSISPSETIAQSSGQMRAFLHHNLDKWTRRQVKYSWSRQRSNFAGLWSSRSLKFLEAMSMIHTTVI